ncbi:hypothetical protein AB0M47_02145 [Hamadaea sp. NPDC051192]|uniref:hypothetical protein n=1 Tax=Hamadaea sp. NPDC051192 TaxID=3154940 RepID=UPI00343E0931
MTSTSTSTSTWTIVHTATHLADVILGSIADILGHLGIDATQLFSSWAQDESAITAWIAEESLESVVLECHRPSGSVSPILEFPVSYTVGGVADKTFTADRASLARYLAKLETVPKGTTYRLFVTFRKARTPQPGWSSATRAGTNGMRSSSFGTLAGAPHGSAGLRYFTSR